MEKKDLRIVFMGTPEFAVGTLSRLVENGYNVVAVVTQPDKPVGRHQDQLRQAHGFHRPRRSANISWMAGAA